MPFAYYGAKHGLAPKYPRPHHPVVVEPFAGSAAYATRWAAHVDHAILIDINPQLVDLWHELQTMTVTDVDLIGKQLEQERFTHLMLAGMAGSSTTKAILEGKPQTVTPRMKNDWRTVRRRIVDALPHIRTWDIKLGIYTDAPDIEATWHIDPPYQPLRSLAGDGYTYAKIDYAELGEWCKSRQGLVMVCEQSPAEWLPFSPLASQGNAASNSDKRVEVIWRNDMEQPALF